MRTHTDAVSSGGVVVRSSSRSQHIRETTRQALRVIDGGHIQVGEKPADAHLDYAACAVSVTSPYAVLIAKVRQRLVRQDRRVRLRSRVGRVVGDRAIALSAEIPAGVLLRCN